MYTKRVQYLETLNKWYISYQPCSLHNHNGAVTVFEHCGEHDTPIRECRFYKQKKQTNQFTTQSGQSHNIQKSCKKIPKWISLSNGPEEPLLDGPEKEENNPKITGESQNPKFEEKRIDSTKKVGQSRNPSRFNLRSAKHFSE